MLGNLFGRIAAYPVWMQTLLYLALMLAALVVFGLLVLLSPFVMMLAGLVLSPPFSPSSYVSEDADR